jgi:hypothetical protein
MLRRKEASGENYEAAHSMRIVDPDQYPPGRLFCWQCRIKVTR